MADKNTLKNWFKTGLKPTQAQFWAWIDSYWHKDEAIPATNIEGLDTLLEQKANKEPFDAHLLDTNAHDFLAFKLMLFGTTDVDQINDNLNGYPSLYDWSVAMNDAGGIGLGVRIERREFTYTTGAQQFTLPYNYLNVFSVEVQGQGALSTSQYNLIAPNKIEITDPLGVNDYVVVLYTRQLEGAEDYYTKAQVDGLLANYVQIPVLNDYYTKTESEALITQLINGAPNDANTLKELNDKILAINAIIGGIDPDGDALVDTVAELLQVFETFPEGADIATILAGKINASDIVNNLTQAVAGKVLDASQGKVLKDLIDALTTVVAGKVSNSDTRLSDARPASDVYSWAKNANKPAYNQDEVGDGATYKQYSDTEKTKLSAIQTGAQVNPVPWRPNYNVSGNSTTSTTYVALISQTVGAVPAGLWSLILFSADVFHSNNDVLVTFALHLNGAILLTTERTVSAHQTRRYNIGFQTNFTLAAGNTIEVRWKTASGTATVVNGTLSVTN